jgi:hypothetical protein
MRIYKVSDLDKDSRRPSHAAPAFRPASQPSVSSAKARPAANVLDFLRHRHISPAQPSAYPEAAT